MQGRKGQLPLPSLVSQEPLRLKRDKSEYCLPCRSWMECGGCNNQRCKYPHIWSLEATTLLQQYLKDANVADADRDTLIDTFRHAVHLYAVVHEGSHRHSRSSNPTCDTVRKVFWIYYSLSLGKSMPGKDEEEIIRLAEWMHLAVQADFTTKHSVNDAGAAERKTISRVLNVDDNALLLPQVKKKGIKFLLRTQDELSLLSGRNAWVWAERAVPLLKEQQRVNFCASLTCLAYLPPSSASSTSRQLPASRRDPEYDNSTIFESSFVGERLYYTRLCKIYDAVRNGVTDPRLLQAIGEDEQIAQES